MIPHWVAGEQAVGSVPLVVRGPHDPTPVAAATWATAAQVERAVAAAWAARRTRTPARVRADALAHVSRRLAERADEAAELVTAESGKPIRWARAEIARAVATFRWGAEEARRFSGTVQRLDTDPGSDGRVALVRRVPRGPVLGITPFNFPVNLVAHKLAPAIAAGAPVVLKPAPSTPLSALLLGSLLAETDLPAGTWSVLPVPNAEAAALAADTRLPVVSFTGSDRVGHLIRDANPAKHVLLELGGNAAAVVCQDWADLDHAAGRIAELGTYQAGQSCVSVQRVYAHRAVYDELVALLVAKVSALAVGDPRDPTTHVGPLIDEAAAARVAGWVADAVSGAPRCWQAAPATARTWPRRCWRTCPPGARCSPRRCSARCSPCARTTRWTRPSPWSTPPATACRPGCSPTTCAWWTGWRRIWRSAASVPTYRADQMPYGGVKDSGNGREGVAAAMDDLTEPRVLVLRGLGY